MKENADQESLLALARSLGEHHLHVVDLPYRLSSWALDEPKSSALWFDAQGALRAWAVMQTPFWTIDYVCSPYHDDLHQHILAWADDRAQAIRNLPAGRPAWFVNVFADQIGRREDLEAAGFACQSDVGEDSWSKVLMQRTGHAALPNAPLPAGFTIRPLAGEAEVAAYVSLQQAVFESRNMTAEWRRRILQHPDHRDELDLVAVAPDGSLAAFCVGWQASDVEGETVGQIEPMGVRPDLRLLGVGRAILIEAVQRLYRNGATRVLVETDRQRDAALGLYESVGFRVQREVLVYRKDYKVAAASGPGR